MRIIRTILFGLCFILPMQCFAQSDADQLINVLGSINSLQANFDQTVNDANGGVLQSAQGTMSILRPGKFRWEIKAPAQQLLIADGNYIWFYDVDLAQVTKQKQQAAENGSPAMLLSGSVQKLAQDFIITAQNTNNKNALLFKLVPRSKQAMFQQVTLNFTDGKLRSMKLFDNLNQATIVNFSAVKNNPQLNAKLFIFTPPKDVDVVTQ